MDSAIRERALKSAAKVAFGASVCWGAALTACGGKSVYGGEEWTDDGELGGGGLATSARGGASAGATTGGNGAGGTLGGPGAAAARGGTGAAAASGGTGSVAAGGSVAVGGNVAAGGSVAAAGSATTGGSGPAGGSAGMGGAGAGPFDGGSQLACTTYAGPPNDARRWTLEVFACCVEYVGEQLGDGGTPDIPALASDPSLVSCCRYITSSYYDLRDDAGAPPPFPLIQHNVCCADGVLTPDEIGGSFCSPWGPPVPPALPVAPRTKAGFAGAFEVARVPRAPGQRQQSWRRLPRFPSIPSAQPRERRSLEVA